MGKIFHSYGPEKQRAAFPEILAKCFNHEHSGIFGTVAVLWNFQVWMCSTLWEWNEKRVYCMRVQKCCLTTTRTETCYSQSRLILMKFLFLWRFQDAVYVDVALNCLNFFDLWVLENKHWNIILTGGKHYLKGEKTLTHKTCTVWGVLWHVYVLHIYINTSCRFCDQIYVVDELIW